ncbi:RhoGAP domain-containing protein [Tieghemostelium lacteum]|uniref:RhoGAP domain-containing protein n=1 Tax=Tieghemostelium lacteum TaxID=361077 RepID=A0A151ZDR9_TIELA|nr:RhoGAP domain-containing protein [Tieghemostelium lacteum]|eukprot:KYQ92034.1 RhoGAP domain-containing protein [Tieghemostelium lacteum]
MTTDVKKLKFTDNLWDGFDVLVKRTESDLAQSKNILMFFKKKAELEEQHSKKLEKLAQKMNMSLEEVNNDNSHSFYVGWKKVIGSSQLESDQHTLINTSILNKVCQPIQAMIKDLEIKRKRIVSEGIKLKHDMKEMVEALKKSQLKYEKSSRDLEQARLELKDLRETSTNSDSDLNNISKAEKKVQRLEIDASGADDEYKEQIKATNDFQNFYNVEAMPKILNDFEHFILSHFHLSKTYLVNYTNLLNDQPPMYISNYEGVRRTIDQVDKDKDIQDFIKKNQMKKQLSEPFKYEPYVEGKLQVKKSKINQLFTGTLRGIGGGSGGGSGSPNTSSGSLPISANKPQVILPTASFCVSIDELMTRQKDTHPQLEVPRVLVVLAESVTKLKGHVTEGIFRVPGIISTINSLRLQLDQGNFDLSACDDVRTPAALLKRWLRDIPEPIIPASLYKTATDQPTTAMEIVKKIPVSSQKVLQYLINFIQIFCKYEFVAHSKMGVSNMAMIFAPTILRCPSNDPSVLLNSVNNERQFVENLIKNIPPPQKEFMGLPVSMNDAIADSDDIEELLVDTDDDSGNEGISGNSNTTTTTTAVTTPPPLTSSNSKNNISEDTIIIKSDDNNDCNNNNSNNSNNNATDDINNNNNNSQSESIQPPPSSNSGSFTPPPSRNRNASTTLGWVRVKPAAAQTSKPNSE